ncbi:MAG: hypothetical protein ACMUIP_03475 [bacterium]
MQKAAGCFITTAAANAHRSDDAHAMLPPGFLFLISMGLNIMHIGLTTSIVFALMISVLAMTVLEKIKPLNTLRGWLRKIL